MGNAHFSMYLFCGIYSAAPTNLFASWRSLVEISNGSGKCNMCNRSSGFLSPLQFKAFCLARLPAAFFPCVFCSCANWGQPLSISMEKCARLWSGVFYAARGTVLIYLGQTFEVSHMIFLIHWRLLKCGIILDKQLTLFNISSSLVAT